MLETNIKKYLKITYIFSSSMWHLPREIFDLAIETLDKVRRLKKHGGWLQWVKDLSGKLVSKWEIITRSFKNPMCLEIKCPVLDEGISKKP